VGRGIAQRAALSGLNGRLYDIDQQALVLGKVASVISGNIEKMIEAGRMGRRNGKRF